MKLPVNLHLGIPRWFNQNKQTNKQITNKHSNSLVNQQYLSQIKSDIYKTFRETFCQCPKMIKIKKNKQINKKKTNNLTNKHFQSNFRILNISAKSSQIFTKFSGDLSLGVPIWLKQKKQISKQTNKQKNKLTFT